MVPESIRNRSLLPIHLKECNMFYYIKLSIAAMITLLYISCDFLTGLNDPSVYLEPEYLEGEWLRITEVPSYISGLYEKDTISYRIGIDPMPDVGTGYKRDPMAFYIHYDRGYYYGYIYDPEENYDSDEELSTLRYILVEGLPSYSYESYIDFSMPEEDSLIIQYGGEVFGTRRK